MRVIGTAGHVDHGKSSLVLALTGTDPDRWDEEKRRGLTIDLGFAFTALPSGQEVGFVDVPGHVRFIKNMLAGAGAVDAVVLVVAATEGWMPQTEEHLRILELLGTRQGLVALTMADRVDAETLEIAGLEIADRLAGSFLAGAPVVACDSRSGRGLGDVVAALDALLRELPPPADRDRPRLWVDRAFSLKGAGTVVTGTLEGGSVRVGDDLLVVPGNHAVRVRGVQRGHAPAEACPPGSRVALNLSGVDPDQVPRGAAVVRPGQWEAVTEFDGGLEVLPGPNGVGGEGFGRVATVKLFAGAGEFDARLRPDGHGHARIRILAGGPLPLAAGDRAVIRDPGSETTIGGVVVLDPAPRSRLAAAAPHLDAPLPDRLLALRGVVTLDTLARHGGLDPQGVAGLAHEAVGRDVAVMAGATLISSATAGALVESATAAVDAHHADHPLEPGLAIGPLAAREGVEPEVLAAVACPPLVLAGGVLHRPGHAPSPEHDPEARRLLAALEAAPFTPPAPDEVGVDREVARALVRSGAAIESEGAYFAASALDEAQRRITGVLAATGEVSVGDVRDLLGSSRKHVLPILAALDSRGVTRRRGDVRVAGPRAEIEGEGPSG